LQPFRPLVSNPHVLTILSNFWERRLDTVRYPVESRLYRTEPDVQVLMLTQRPVGEPRGEIVLIHGLEGSGEAGYMQTMAQAGLEAGYVVNRFHMRTCGGTAHLCKTLYHAGLTSDLLSVLRQMRDEGRVPAHLVGYSLGGNVALKLTGELGAAACHLIAGVCAVSTPIVLTECARLLARPSNRIYERRFLKRMRGRVLTTGRFTVEQLLKPRSLFEFDDVITAPSFGFRGAEHYYETQSSRQFLDRISVPALIIQAKDDLFIPFEIFDHPAVRNNPLVQLLVTEHGGHLGFISRNSPRFWVDHAVLEWIRKITAGSAESSQHAEIQFQINNRQGE